MAALIAAQREDHRSPFDGDEPGVVTGDLRADGLTCSHPFPDARREPLVLLGSRPVAVPGRVDGRHREAAGHHVAVGAGDQALGLLVLATAMAQQHQGVAAGGTGG